MSSAKRANVLLLIPHLGGGGAEQVIATLARNLNPNRFNVHVGLVTQSAVGVFGLPPSVRVHVLCASRVRFGAWKLIRLVWRLRPALILSGMAHLNLMVLFLRLFFPRHTCLCVRQNGALPATLAAFGNPWIARCLYTAAYRSADRVICQTLAMADELQLQLGVSPRKLVVLPNPLDIDGIRDAASAKITAHRSQRTKLLAIARLDPAKGLDLLLEAFASICQLYPGAELEILGKGPCRPALEAQCTALGIDKHVHFSGEVQFPALYFSGIAAFVLSSRQEGLPNAMLEAAAAGLPIVALPASEGLVSLVSGQPGVWLAKEVSAAALGTALSIALASIQPGQRFSHTWIENFGLKKAIHAYQDMMETVLEQGPS